MSQLKDQVAAFERGAKDPLPPEVLWAIDCVHMQNRLLIFAADNAAGYQNGFRGLIGERVP